MDTPSKAQVKAYVEAQGITCVLNNTKWQRLFELLHKSPFSFRYRRTDIDGVIFPKGDSPSTGEIAQIYGEFWSMEYLEITAIVETRTGMLTEPKVENFTAELIALAHEAGVKFTATNQGIKVYGYIRKSENPYFMSAPNKSSKPTR